MTWLIGHELGHRDAQGLGELLDGFQGYIPFASLNAADVCPVQTGRVSQSLLGKALCCADFSQVVPEARRKVAHAKYQGGYC